MLSQTKMQLWYPKKSSEDSSGRSSTSFLNKYKDNNDVNKNINKGDNHSPALSDTTDGNEEINVEFLSEDDSSRLSPGVSDYEELLKKRKRVDDNKVSDFIDLDYWKRETLCCGTIFRGLYGEMMVDVRFLKPCQNYMVKRKKKIDENVAN